LRIPCLSLSCSAQQSCVIQARILREDLQLSLLAVTNGRWGDRHSGSSCWWIIDRFSFTQTGWRDCCACPRIDVLSKYVQDHRLPHQP